MTHFYFAACAPASAGGGVYHYVREGDSLIFRDRLPCDRPMYLDLADDDMQILLRAPFEAESSPRANDSGLIACAVRADGSLSEPGDMICTRGAEACHLSRFQGQTYVTNYLSGSVFSTGGALDIHHGKGPNAERQDGAHTHFIAPGPDGNDLLSADLGLDAVYCYDTALNVLSVAHVPEGAGARHLAAIGHTVFCANELGNSVTVFDYKAHRLTRGETVPVLNRPVDSTVAAIRTRGKWVYVSNRGDDSVSCLRWQDGRLRLKNVVPTGGCSPRDFLIADDWMLATNEKSDTVTVLRGQAGQWTATGLSLDLPHPLCVTAQERRA